MRALFADNDSQHNRMIRDKRRTLHRVLLYSYQSGWIRKDGDKTANYVRALINPDKIKFDYDEKILSVDFHAGFAPGDTFEWPRGSKTHWIIYSQELTELAYFRGNVRRCQELVVTDPETGEKLSIWCAIRGPVETKINTIQKNVTVFDTPNQTLNIHMPNNAVNQRLFQRYFKFSFAGLTWEVQAADFISTPGIIEFTAMESYKCDSDEEIYQIVDPNPVPPEGTPAILGNSFIKPLQEVLYTITGDIDKQEWTIELDSDNKEVDDVLQYHTDENGDLVLKWTTVLSGNFVIHYGDLSFVVAVESLF